MLVQEFLQYYADAISTEAFAIYKAHLGIAHRRELAESPWFFSDDKGALGRQFDFYDAVAQLKEEGLWLREGIIFDLPDNVAFPFFACYVLRRLPERTSARWRDLIDVNTLGEPRFRDLRSALRTTFCSSIDAQVAEELNEIIALINFSSSDERLVDRLRTGERRGLEGRRVLDAGCGSGFASLLTSTFADVVGVDSCMVKHRRSVAVLGALQRRDSALIERWVNCVQREAAIVRDTPLDLAIRAILDSPLRVTFQHGDLSDFAGEGFDAALLLDVIEHLPHAGPVLYPLTACLRPGARLLVTAPTPFARIIEHHYAHRWGALFPSMMHFHHYSVETLITTLGAFALQPESVTMEDPWISTSAVQLENQIAALSGGQVQEDHERGTERDLELSIEQARIGQGIPVAFRHIYGAFRKC